MYSYRNYGIINYTGDLMTNKIEISYTAIFKYDTDRQKYQYQGEAWYEKKDDSVVISFVDGENKTSLRVQEQAVYLQNNASCLQLQKGVIVHNQYQTMYGAMHIDGRLETVEIGDTIKIRYQLLDQGSLLSTVYILITFSGGLHV